MSHWEKNLKLYDSVVKSCDRFIRKGKTMPYTSANGYMFSLLNKAGEFGIRFSTAEQAHYINLLSTTVFKSHNSIVKGYVLIPDLVLQDKKMVIELLNQSYDYVMTLPPK